MTKKTLTATFGKDNVEKLAAIAIDILCYPPADIQTFSTRVSKKLIEEGRGVMEDAGIPWRGLKGSKDSQEYARRQRVS